MTYADSSERQALVSGLREIADFLESRNDVPAPNDAYVFVFPPHDAPDDVKRNEIDVIASLIGSKAKYSAGQHYLTTRRFGPVEYRAVAIPAKTDEEK